MRVACLIRPTNELKAHVQYGKQLDLYKHRKLPYAESAHCSASHTVVYSEKQQFSRSNRVS